MEQARACFAQRAFAEAEDLYRQALALEPDHPEVLTNLGSVLLLQQNLAPAEEAYRAALAHQPELLPALLGLTNTLIMARQFDAALDAVRRAERLEDVPPEVRAELSKLAGIAHHGQGEVDEAIACFEAYAAACPEASDPLDCLYSVQAASGRDAEALATLELITEQFPERIDALTTLVRSLQRQGVFRKMNGLFAKMVTAAPADATVFNLIVHLSLAEKKYAHARLYFEQALRNMPELNVDDHAALAIARGLA